MAFIANTVQASFAFSVLGIPSLLDVFKECMRRRGTAALFILHATSGKGPDLCYLRRLKSRPVNSASESCQIDWIAGADSRVAIDSKSISPADCHAQSLSQQPPGAQPRE